VTLILIGQRPKGNADGGKKTSTFEAADPTKRGREELKIGHQARRRQEGKDPTRKTD